MLLAVNRPYGKSDYIPCICWGRNAKYAEALATGTHMKVWGRIQSRSYIKKINENDSEERTAYEVSLNKIKVIDEPEAEDVEEVASAETSAETSAEASAEATENSGF